MDLNDFFGDGPDADAFVDIVLDDDDAPADQWLSVSLDFRASPLPFEELTGDISPLTALPQAALVRVCSFLDWTALLHLRVLANKRLAAALTLAWPQMAVNTWALLEGSAAQFECGRIKLSLVGSVERLRRGEVTASLMNASLRALVASNSAAEPVAKAQRLETPERDVAVAKLITVMYQTLLATAQGAQPLLRAVEDAQRQSPACMPAGTAQTVAQLHVLFERAREALRNYRKKVVIPNSHLRDLWRFEELIEQHAVHLGVLRNGWRFAAEGGPFPAALVWVRQQAGVVLRPTQRLGSHQGRLLVAPCAEALLAEPLPKCALVCKEKASEPASDVMAEVSAAFSESRVASFDGLKFVKPSRQRPVSLWLECELRTKSGVVAKLQSAPSCPMLAYAHQKQLASSCEILLKHCTFRDKQSVSWPTLCNALREFFCARLHHAEEQRPARPVVGLSAGDLEYIRSKFFGRAQQIKADQTDDFLQFIGPLFFSLIINRSYVELWNEGYLAGFVGRDALNLTEHGPGSFLLRFSTQMPGEVVISFVGGGVTKHYLVSESDVSPKSRQTLAAFLWKTPNLKHILRLSEVNGERALGRLVKQPKEEVLRVWLADNIPAMVNGYDFQQ